MSFKAPEVVKRGEYSYAVDWWALGCIVLEALVGRVRVLFLASTYIKPCRSLSKRTKTSLQYVWLESRMQRTDDLKAILWEKILRDPWDDVFRDPRLARRSAEYFGLDPITWGFIDSVRGPTSLASANDP